MNSHFKCLNHLIFLLFLLPLLFMCSCNKQGNKKIESDKSQEWSVRMVDSEINRLGNRLEYDASNKRSKWSYETGLFLSAILKVYDQKGNPAYLDFAKRVIDSFIDENGKINAYKMSDYNLDKINSGKALLRLYELTREPKYMAAADTLREQLRHQPRTESGGFWHKKRYPWQMWLDGLYMASPFLAQYSEMIIDTNGFDDVVNQILLVDVKTRDPRTGLRYHAWDESFQQKWANKETGTSPNFWGRAMGWYVMALVDVLDYLPKNHPHREKVVFILDDLLKSLAKYQDEETGLWYQVVDQGDRKGNYLEASASAMYVYGYAKAVNKGYIDQSFRAVAEKGYNGLIDNLVEERAEGEVDLTQICSVAGLGGKPYRDGSYEYYVNEPIAVNDLKGVGPFIMASVQIENMK